ncbi:MAG TPA: phosphotransferase, partial [Propionibacteriaceae bacterium]|nr:phosphotransferase [Propionibacteriaceae bacterium]
MTAQRPEELWWPHVREARWFQGKGREGWLASVTPLDWLVPPGGEVSVRPELALVTYADGESELYQLLVSYRDTPSADDAAVVGRLAGQWVGDAPRDGSAMAAVVEALRDETVREGAGLDVRVVSPLPGGDLTPRWYAGQQSNTNVFLGTDALLKVFRKLEPGENRDIVMTRRLREAGVTDVPGLYGYVEGRLDGVSYDLAALTEQLHDPRDGWELACESCRTGSDFTAHAAALGHALAAVHRGLGADASTLHSDVVADQMSVRLDLAAAAAPVLHPYVPALRRRFDALRGRSLPVQSVHGDFHLGQTLLTPDGWRIIDFEGEPLKSFAERLAPDSVWRDVAGMTRSLAYATSAHADPSGAAAQNWLTPTRQAFLGAYCGDQQLLDEDVLSA